MVGTTNRSIAAIPSAWVRRNVLQPCDGGSRRLTMYLATLVCPISMPSLRSSPWIRGAPHRGPLYSVDSSTRAVNPPSLHIPCSTVGKPDVISAEDKVDRLEACTALPPQVAAPDAQQREGAAGGRGGGGGGGGGGGRVGQPEGGGEGAAEPDAQREAAVEVAAEPDAQRKA